MSSNVTPGFRRTVLNNIFAPNGRVIGPNMAIPPDACKSFCASRLRGRTKGVNRTGKDDQPAVSPGTAGKWQASKRLSEDGKHTQQRFSGQAVRRCREPGA